jgi:glycerol-1-phosphate dehydrogenase [NAD(P)+]
VPETPDRPLEAHLADWLGADRPCTCGHHHVVHTRKAPFGLLETTLPDLVAELNLQGTALVAMDAHTRPIAGQRAVDALTAAGHAVTPHVMTAGNELLIPDEKPVDATLAVIDAKNIQWVIGVGAGTVNDVCKYAAAQRGLPYVAVPTAASMNGYTSTIAALKQRGLKVTVPAEAPIAVAVDPALLRQAPAIMQAAGYADLLSKYVCNADWCLSHLIDGGYYCQVPYDLASAATDQVVAKTADIANQSEEGIRTLTAALLLSGVAMAAAGSSSPASGGEHLVSHYWEMTLPGCGTGRRFHGTQVGIGILIASTLYEHLRTLTPADIDPASIAAQQPPWPQLEADLRDHFGPIAGPVIQQAKQKHRTPQEAAERAEMIASRWDELWSRLDGIARPTNQIRDWLTAVGAPVTVTELGLTPDDLRRSLRYARHLRNRYTCLDFAADLGQFTHDHQAQYLRDSATYR